MKPAATRSKSPVERSAFLSSSAPAFDVIDPPSNAAVTLRPWHLEMPGKRAYSVWASVLRGESCQVYGVHKLNIPRRSVASYGCEKSGLIHRHRVPQPGRGEGPPEGNWLPVGLLPPTLAVTIYNGRASWAAPDDVLDLIEPVRGWLASRQPRLRHEILDLRALAAQGATEGNVVSWVASMELDSSAANISRVVQEVLDVYPGPEHARLREAFPGVDSWSGGIVGNRRRGFGASQVTQGGWNDLCGRGRT